MDRKMKALLCVSATGFLGMQSPAALSDSITDAITGGKAYGDFRLRYESVDQDNMLKDASALTLRSRLGYKTGAVSGFSALLEVEDSRTVAGIDDYNNTLGHHTEYSVIADPETTEVDQAFMQYQGNGLTAKAGRQVLTYDNHRFVGHVGWRQDRQTYDGVSLGYKASDDITLGYAYLDKRNRIFAEGTMPDGKDIDSSDHLVNLKFKTGIGTVVAYAYLLEMEESAAGASLPDNDLDTYGLRFSGSSMAGETKILYSAEYASQESKTATTDFDADYLSLEAGAVISGVTGKLGYEVLGSDDEMYGFSTPLATLHKFNGWADQFLGTPGVGLVDKQASLSGKALGGKWVIAYHDFEADDASATVDDLGSEWDLLFAKKFGKHYNAGIKYADYSAGDIKVDTEKLWLWVGMSF